MDGVRFTKPVRAVDDIKCLTTDEQQKFMEAAKRSHNYAQYALILETGLRTGEVIGLTWDAIDWKARTLTVNKTLKFRHKQKVWRAGPPKTQHSYRTIPLTSHAYDILKQLYSQVSERKESELLNSTLESRWNTWIGAREKLQACVCVILFLSTGEQENRQRTVPMIPTFTNCAMRQESGDSVCTLCATPMQRVQSKAGCSQKCCKNCSVMPASKRRWIATFM